MFNFEGKKVLLTGSTGGIGSVVAKQLSEAGAILGLTDRNPERLAEFAKTLPGKTHQFICDLSDFEATEAMYAEAEKEMGGVDVLICNAGLTRDNLAMRMTDAEWDMVLNVNLKSAFILNRAAIKKMMKRRWGRIINIASIVGVMGNPGQANYAASKGGLIAMSKSIAKEVATRGITINCVAPGFIRTPMTDVLTDDQKSALLSKVPMGALGVPEDIAAGIMYLASDEAKYVTGQTLNINGGMLTI